MQNTYIILIIWLLLNIQKVWGQSPLQITVVNNPKETIQKKTINGGVQIGIKEGPWSHLAIYGNVSLQTQQMRGTDFNTLQNTITWQGELRYFPFGHLRLPSAKSNKVGCPSLDVTFTGRKMQTTALQGFYLAPGYFSQKTSFEYVPLPHLESTTERIPFSVKLRGPTLHAGYQLQFFNLTVGAAYGLALSKPSWTGSMDIFGDTLYTNVYPWKFRLSRVARFELGVHF